MFAVIRRAGETRVAGPPRPAGNGANPVIGDEMEEAVHRRNFLKWGAAAGAASLLGTDGWLRGESADAAGQSAKEFEEQSSFRSDDRVLEATWKAAIAALAGNVVTLPGYRKPVLTEGSVYHGVWLECAPQEGLVYSRFRPEIARNNHTVFFDLQRADGYLPCAVKTDGVEHSQLQLVVPIAATAYELAQKTGDEQLMEMAYNAWSRYDAFLMKYRNTRGTGLIEAFCTYDTGQDNSPRWKGIPRQCLNKDARWCPKAPGMPRLCPDLSASVYGGRMANAAMARAMGKDNEAAKWEESAHHIGRLIMERLYCEPDGAFYDVDTENHFVKILSVAIPRVLGEHVVDQKTFEHVYTMQMHNPKAFWAPYPLPSIALDDPEFVRPIPRNSWGGAAQALTALRATRWMEYYGKPADLAWMMSRWIEAITRHIEFRQQIDPLTGDFTEGTPGGYSPAALVFVDYLWRLHGVRETGETLEWNVRAPQGTQAEFSLKVGQGRARLGYGKGAAELTLDGKTVATVRGTGRLITDRAGRLLAGVGTEEKPVNLEMTLPGAKSRIMQLPPNQRVAV